MRRKLIAANWKMNKTIAQAEAFSASLKSAASDVDHCDLLVIPPFFAVPAVVSVLAGTAIAVGAQDLYVEDSGAFTGEISASMIVDAGAEFVLVGHSERRHVLGEDNEIVAQKLAAALAGGLTPILCVGERIDERESGAADAVVIEQLSTAMNGVDDADMPRIVIAYEPVWAIGTGLTATPEDAEGMHIVIRDFVRSGWGGGIADGLRIQYGGSVKPANASALMGRDGIDGALVGGASLDVESFIGIAAGVPR